MKKCLTAAEVRREIITGLTESFEQTDNMLEAAEAEDADVDEVAIRMVTDEDCPDESDNDRDFYSVDAECNAQEDDDDEGKPKPKPEAPLTSGLISIRSPRKVLQRLRTRHDIQPPADKVGDVRVTPPVHVGYAFRWYGLSVAGTYVTRVLMQRG
jgi:hypothetical protein